MRLVAYVRVSTDEQSLSLEAQEARIRAYCELYGHTIVAVHTDRASGRSVKGRAGLAAALTEDSDGLIIAKLDRLTRSVSDLGLLLSTLEGLALVSVGEQIDTTTAAGRLVLHILTSVAQWEREAISERTSAALQAKRARGERAGETPFGWAADETGRLHRHEGEAAIVARVLELHHKGLSLRSIARMLDVEGLRGRTGAPLSHTQVARIVSRIDRG